MPNKQDKKIRKFASVYNDTDGYGSMEEVAEELGIAVQTAKNKAVLYRKESALRPDLPNIISRAKPPLSEDTTRFMEDWGKDQCIQELLRVREIDPDRAITRNHFRIHSAISEATWNRYFGTFEEFIRQSNIKLSRQQHGLERQIAKHASVDHYRDLNNERRNWGESYIRDNSKRFKSILFASDLHDIEIDRFYLRVLIDTARRSQPDIICLAGDIFDLAEFGKYGVDPREWDVVGRIQFVHDEILAPLREACPDAQFDLIEGNHENRLMRHLADATPALRAVLSDLHGFTVSKLLGLEQFEINYVALSDLSTFTKAENTKELAKNYRIYWDTVLANHFPAARNMGLPGVNGHHHRHQVWPMFSPIFGAYEWHQLGAGHIRHASYCQGENWHNGFALCNVDTETKSTAFDYVAVTDFAIAGGQWYYRDASEAYAAGCHTFTGI